MAHILAYLDPGAGSMLLQMILAGVLGLSYTIKIYWQRILAFVRLAKPEDERPAAESSSTDDQP